MTSVHKGWLRWLDAAGCRPRVIRAEAAVAIRADCPLCEGRKALTVIAGDPHCSNGCPPKHLAARLCDDDDREELGDRCPLTACRHHLDQGKTPSHPRAIGNPCALDRYGAGGMAWSGVGRALGITKQTAEAEWVTTLARVRELIERPKRAASTLPPRRPASLAIVSTTRSGSSTRGRTQ